mmetsp:Transcript_85502/g.164617  ORF Transcript_85502/g.164617 Transcript_85502/m.164617 type:complete len:368 (+) Transcript_85502:47-1150(+)
MASHLGSSHVDETRIALQLESAVKLTERFQHAALPGTVKRALQKRCVDQVLALITTGKADADNELDHTDAIGCLDVALSKVAESKGHHGILSITDAKSWLRAFGETGKQAATLLGKVSGNRNQQAHPTLSRFLATLKLVQHENAPDRAVEGHIATCDTSDCTTEAGSTAGHGSWCCVPPGEAPLVASPAVGSECSGSSDDNSGYDPAVADPKLLKAAVDAHHKAIGRIGGVNGVTSTADWEAVNTALGSVIALVPESTVMKVYDSVSDITDPGDPAYKKSLVNDTDAEAAVSALLTFKDVVKKNQVASAGASANVPHGDKSGEAAKKFSAAPYPFLKEIAIDKMHSSTRGCLKCGLAGHWASQCPNG